MLKKSLLTLVVLAAIFCATATSALASYRYYGVYKTDAHGDVYFRYPAGGKFVRLYCSKYIWDVGPYTGNPNDWKNWEIVEYSPDKGWKLLVPTRVRWWFFLKYFDHIDNYLGIKIEY